ncbi:MAG TPA: methylmalonyl-CoA mutase subunit beta [Xanthobacteraceae bacterium]|nr:methylmalonyl-CoA mutase subunit beta [Xanthobacteraceae bacterium]
MSDAQHPTAEFPPATAAAWRSLVDAVLKGAPFAKLESRTHGGLTIEPLYPRDAAAIVICGRAPGAPWTVLQRVDHPDPAAANAQALEDLQNGATGLVLVFAGSVSANGFGLDPSAETLKRALDGVQLDAGIAIDLNLSPATRHAAREFASLAKSRSLDPAKVDLRASINPVGGFAASGHGAKSWKDLANDFSAIVGALAGEGFRGPFAVADGRIVHNAGGSEAQELAFALASAVAYLRALEANGMSLSAARDAIYFRLSADTEQFLTMAKFRAARRLWARIEQACGLAPKPALVTAETAWRTMSKRDPYVNMLRNTIAVTAAGLGGADAITVLPHTVPIGLPDAFARRIARNTQLVLIEESSLARVADPAAGSGALEAITEQMCHAAWSAFQEIEGAGGVWAALERGLVQEKIAAVRAEREKAISRRTDILTGTNDYPNLHETAPAVLDVAQVEPPQESAATITAVALPRIRLAEPFEALRDASDQILARTGARPKVFLATLGKLADYGARENFARNFFEAGGIEAVGGECAAADLAAAFKASGAAIACLCGSDRAYDSEGETAAAALKSAGARHIYLASRPGAREVALRAAGMQSFVYAGSDALATLRAAYDILR